MHIFIYINDLFRAFSALLRVSIFLHSFYKILHEIGS